MMLFLHTLDRVRYHCKGSLSPILFLSVAPKTDSGRNETSADNGSVLPPPRGAPKSIGINDLFRFNISSSDIKVNANTKMLTA